MATIHSLLGRFRALDTDMVAHDAVDRSSEAMGKTVAEQMLAGKNGKGEPIGKYKNPAYARKKHALNPIPGLGNVDLKLHGPLHRGIYVDVQGNVIKSYSTVPYAEKNEEKYGPEIYQLGGQYRISYVQQHLKPQFQQIITEKTGLKFKP